MATTSLVLFAYVKGALSLGEGRIALFFQFLRPLNSPHSTFSLADPPPALSPRPSPHIIQDAFPLQLPGSINVAEKETG